MTQRTAKKRIIALCLTVFMLVCLLPSAALAAEDDIEYLAFTSDVHNSGSSNPAKNSTVVMQSWLETIAQRNGEPFVQMGFCGDYGAVGDGVSESGYWQRAQGVMDVVADTDAVQGSGFFVAGNHENDQGKLQTTSNPTASAIKRPGETEVRDSYVLYSFGAESKDMNNGFSTSAVEDLGAYLATAPTDKPIFILSHFPLHSFSFSESGRTKYRTAPNAEAVVEMLNAASKTHTIIFLWGHNHSQNDPMYDSMITPYSEDAVITLDVETGKTAALRFTYAAAGSMSNSATFTWGGSVKARGMVASINKATKAVTLAYYDSNKEPFCETPVYAAGELAVQCGERTLSVIYLPKTDGDVVYAAAFYDDNGKMLAVHTLTRRAGETPSASFQTASDFAAWRAMVLSAGNCVPLTGSIASPPADFQ